MKEQNIFISKLGSQSKTIFNFSSVFDSACCEICIIQILNPFLADLYLSQLVFLSTLLPTLQYIPFLVCLKLWSWCIFV